MAAMLRIAALAYLALALVWLGLQIPIRLSGCGEPSGCAASLVSAPFWALIWPVYWPLSELFPHLVTIAVVVLMVPIFAAALLLGAWQRWVEARFEAH